MVKILPKGFFIKPDIKSLLLDKQECQFKTSDAMIALSFLHNQPPQPIQKTRRDFLDQIIRIIDPDLFHFEIGNFCLNNENILSYLQ